MSDLRLAPVMPPSPADVRVMVSCDCWPSLMLPSLADDEVMLAGGWCSTVAAADATPPMQELMSPVGWCSSVAVVDVTVARRCESCGLLRLLLHRGRR